MQSTLGDFSDVAATFGFPPAPMPAVHERATARLLQQLGTAKAAKKAAEEMKCLITADHNYAAAFAAAGGAERLVEVLRGPAPIMAKATTAFNIYQLTSRVLEGRLLQVAIQRLVMIGLVQLVTQLASESPLGQRGLFLTLLCQLLDADQGTAVQHALNAEPATMRQLVGMMSPVPPIPLDCFLARLMTFGVSGLHRRRTVEAGAIPGVLQLLTRGSVEARKLAAGYFWVVASHGCGPDMAATAGCLPALLADMGASRVSSHLVSHLQCLRDVAFVAEGAAGLLDCGGVEALVKVLKSRSRGGALRLRCTTLIAQALTHLLLSPRGSEAGAALLRCGALPLLLAEIGRSDDVSLDTEDTYACALLAFLAVTPGGFPAFTAAGGVARLVAELEGGVVLPGLRLISILTMSELELPTVLGNLPTTVFPPEDLVGSADSRRLPEAATSPAAFAALGFDTEAQLAAVLAAGGCGAVVALLGDGQLCSVLEEENAVWVLHHLARPGPAGVKLIYEARGVPVLLGLDWCGSNKRLLAAAGHTLGFMALYGDEHVRRALRDSRALPPLVLQLWSEDKETEEMALTIIRQMQRCFESEREFFRVLDACGAAAAFLKAVTNPEGSARAREKAVEFLLGLLRPEFELEFSLGELRRLQAWPLLMRVQLPESERETLAQLGTCVEYLCPDESFEDYKPLLEDRVATTYVKVPEALRLAVEAERDVVMSSAHFCALQEEPGPDDPDSHGDWGVDDYEALLRGLALASAQTQRGILARLRGIAAADPAARDTIAAVPSWARDLLRVVEFGDQLASRRAVGALRNMTVGSNAHREEIVTHDGPSIVVRKLGEGLNRTELAPLLGLIRAVARGGGLLRERLVAVGVVEALVAYLNLDEGMQSQRNRPVVRTLKPLLGIPAGKQRLLRALPARWARMFGVAYSQVTVCQSR